MYPPCSVQNLLALPLSCFPPKRRSNRLNTPAKNTQANTGSENPSEIRVKNGFSRFSRENIIISIGQFRPEKNHKLQIDAYNIFIKKYLKQNFPAKNDNHSIPPPPQLILIGGCRNEGVRTLYKNPLITPYNPSCSTK